MEEKKSFAHRFLEVVNAKKDHEDPQGPEQLLRTVVQRYADDEEVSYNQAALTLAKNPDYEGYFGVNVYEDEEGRLEVVFTDSSESTWMPINSIVNAIDDGIWGWFEEEWVIKR